MFDRTDLIQQIESAQRQVAAIAAEVSELEPYAQRLSLYLDLMKMNGSETEFGVQLLAVRELMESIAQADGISIRFEGVIAAVQHAIEAEGMVDDLRRPTERRMTAEELRDMDREAHARGRVGLTIYDPDFERAYPGERTDP